MSEAPWKQLHPGSVAVNLVPRLWGLVRALWPVALAWLYGTSQGGEFQVFDLSLLFFFFAMAAWSTTVHWLTLRYRVADGRLEVRTGVLNRQVRVIAPERIQNIEMVRNVFHRVAGLVEVRIETASGTEVEGLLSALSVDEAEGLIGALGRAREHDPETEEALPLIAQNGLLQLVFHGVTAGRLGAVFVFFGFLAELATYLDPERLENVGGVLGILGWLALLLAAFSGAFVLGVGGSISSHFGFRMVDRDGVLVATEGLFTTRRVELPLSKVQLVSVSEPVLRRLFGFGSVHIETAAARVGEGGIQNSEAMVPYVPVERFAAVIRHAIPDLDVDLDRLQTQLHPPHPRALLRALLVATMRGAVLGGLATWWFGPWGAVVFALVPIGWVTGWLDHRFQGWLVTDRVVVARRGWWNRSTWFVDRAKLQSLQVRQGLFLRNYGLALLRVRVAGSQVELPVLEWEQALALQDQLVRPPRAVEAA